MMSSSPVLSLLRNGLSRSPFLHQLQPVVQCQRQYRQIVVEKEETKTTIKGVRVEDNFKKYAPPVTDETCPLKSRGINITPEDTLILRQFQTSDGEILSQAETGLSTREYYKVISCIKMAQRANLLPGTEPQRDIDGNEVPKLNRYLSRYQTGSRTPIYRRGLWYRKLWFKVGDRRVQEDAPHISNKKIRMHH